MTDTMHRDRPPAPHPGDIDVVAGRPDEASACPACPHPLSEHDAIALRFCRATSAGALDRGCICGTG